MTKIQSLNSEKQGFINSIGYFIMYLMVGVIPHIYKYMVFTPAESESIYFKEPVYADLYMLAKSKAFLFLTVILLGIFIIQLLRKHISFIKDKITVGTGIFAGLVILSSVMSDYQDLVYWGAKDRFEGMWVWLAYLVVFTVARHYGSNKKFIERLLKVFVFSASIMAVFGLMQVWGYDIYTEGFLRWFCFPNNIAENMSAYMTSNTTKTLAVGALYNSNYFGVYCGMGTLGALALSFKDSTVNKWVYGGLMILSYGAMISSRSEAALLGFSVGLFALLLISGEKLWENKIFTLALLLALITVDRYVVEIILKSQSNYAIYIYSFLAGLSLFGGALKLLVISNEKVLLHIKRYSFIISVSVVILSIIGFNLLYKVFPAPAVRNTIEHLIIENNVLELKLSSDEQVKFKFSQLGVIGFGEDGRDLNHILVEDNFVRITTKIRTYEFEYNYYSNGYLATMKYPIELNVFYDGSTIKYVDKITGIGDIQYPEKLKYYSDKGSSFSRRGYIWSVYMPIIQDNIIVGHGLETYSLVFPQKDYIGKNNFFKEQRSMVVDKPHSTYLMLGISMGGLGILFLGLFIVALLNQYFSRIDIMNEYTVSVTLLVVILIAGIFNDSIIPMTVLTFCIGGTVLSHN